MTWQDTIDSVLKDEEVLKALRRRAEETAEWLEHKRWHEEDPTHRGDAVLVTSWDEPTTDSITKPVEQTEDDSSPQRRAPHALWAGCTCESPTIKLLFGEDGEIRNELPAVIETNAYGVAEADATVAYFGANSGGAVEYRPGTSSPNGLYK